MTILIPQVLVQTPLPLVPLHMYHDEAGWAAKLEAEELARIEVRVF